MICRVYISSVIILESVTSGRHEVRRWPAYLAEFQPECHREPKSFGILSLAKLLHPSHLYGGEPSGCQCDWKAGENANQRTDHLGLLCKYSHHGRLRLWPVPMANCRPGCSLHNLLSRWGKHMHCTQHFCSVSQLLKIKQNGMLKEILQEGINLIAENTKFTGKLYWGINTTLLWLSYWYIILSFLYFGFGKNLLMPFCFKIDMTKYIGFFYNMCFPSIPLCFILCFLATWNRLVPLAIGLFRYIWHIHYVL